MDPKYQYPHPEDLADGEPRCLLTLLLDTSGSMDGEPITKLNEALVLLSQELKNDPFTRRRVDISVITFGNNGVLLMKDVTTADSFIPPTLTAGNGTPMGEAIAAALVLQRACKDAYRQNGIPYYRPWIFLLTDGMPTDNWTQIIQPLHDIVANKGALFFAIGVGNEVDENILSQIAPASSPPKKLDGMKFNALFQWLSGSMGMVSRSKPGEQTKLPSTSDWDGGYI